MRTSTVVAILLVIIIILIGGWYFLWGNNSYTPSYSSTTQTTNTQASSSPQAGNLTLGMTSSPALGNYLVAYNGMTLYTFAKDSTGTSTCYGQCATLWPAYTAAPDASLVAESPISGSVGVITRADGTSQVTYNGLPLYFYYKDTAPEQTNGQGVGGVWFVAKP